MIVVGSTYWNMVYGREVDDVLKDDEGIANMRNLGRNMYSMLFKLNSWYHAIFLNSIENI